MERMALSWLKGSKRKKPRSYSEGPFGHRITAPWWKCLIVRWFGDKVMSTGTMTIYRYRGALYVLK